jgi:hypothetical protein
MKTIADLADLASVSETTAEGLSTPRGRALATFAAARRFDRLEWQTNGATVALLWCGAGEYGVTMDGAQIEKGILEATLDTVVRVMAGLALQPTPTARRYEQVGYWADLQNGQLMSYAMYSDGGWDKSPARVEFACQHVLDRVNADFGTAFTMEDFEEDEDCTCDD